MITVTQGLLKYCSELLTAHRYWRALFAALLLYPTTIVEDEIFSGFKEERRIQP